MRTTRTVSALAGSVLLAMSLVGCSEAEKAAEDAKGKAADAANSAKEKAGEEGKKAAEDAKKKMGDKGKKAAEDAKKKAGGGKGGDEAGGKGDKAGSKTGADGGGAGGAGGASDMTVELGEFASDKNAKAVAGFFEARQVALASDGGDTADLKASTTPEHFEKSSAFVKKNAGKQKATTVTVVGVEGGSVNVCAGPQGTNARTLTVEGGKVAANAKGQHTCK